MSLLRTVVASARSAIGRMFGGAREQPATLHASYEVLRPGSMDGHWGNRDALSADAANSRDVRHGLMHRSRLEYDNSGYYAGSHRTHAVAVVGSNGPRLRMQTESVGFNQAVERDWESWFAAVKGRRKLACMVLAWKKDGEVFALLQNNPGIGHAITLDFDPIEAEVCQSPILPTGVAGRIDGIHSDEYGNVIAYDILPAHPGSGQILATQKADYIPARNVLHLFSLERPGQHRAVPACSSTLNLGARGRRMREAVVRHQEIAASITGVLETNNTAANDEPAATLQAMTTVPAAAGSLMALPRQWKLESFKSDQPKTGYAEFNKQQVAEAARPLGQPHSIAACDASDGNFSSLKTNHLTYYAQVNFDRCDVDELILERLFIQWWIERELLRGKTLAEVLARPISAHSFQWPAQPSADRNADAQAVDTGLRNGTLTLSRAHSDAGLDFEDELTQAAKDFGISTYEMRKILLATYFPAAAQVLAPAPPQSETDTELEETADETALV